ncbi:MAG: hypothetical protein OHK006_06040 [Thermodesulfovibrionales bacterium]
MLRAEKKYADKNLTVLWIGHQDRTEKLTAYARQNSIPDYLYDPDDGMSRKFGMTYGGGVVFVNRDGIVKSRVPKGISASSLEAELQKIL